VTRVRALTQAKRTTKGGNNWFIRPILFYRTGANSDASDGRRDPTHRDSLIGTVIRYSFSMPTAETALTLGP
jgi:hypothetical protein